MNQSLQLKIDTGVDLTSATLLRIDYMKPNGTTAVFDTGITVENLTTLVYNIPKNTLSLTGKWSLYAYVEDGAQCWYGELTTFNNNSLYT